MSRSCTRGAEVQGRALDAVVTAVSALAPATRMRVRSILAEADVLYVSPDEWYPLGAYVDALTAIESSVGSSKLRKIGQQHPTVAADTAGPTEPSAILHSLDETYGGTHRGGRAGGYEFRTDGPTTGTIVSTTPYPDSFDRGVLESTFAGRTESDVYARITPAGGFDEPGVDTSYDVTW